MTHRKWNISMFNFYLLKNNVCFSVYDVLLILTKQGELKMYNKSLELRRIKQSAQGGTIVAGTFFCFGGGYCTPSYWHPWCLWMKIENENTFSKFLSKYYT